MFNFKNFFAGLVIAVTGITVAQASDFVGPYAGVKIGQNESDASGEINKSSHSTTFPGMTAGYNFDVGSFIVGPEVFADMHHGSTTYKDAGADIKFGMPYKAFLPYGRFGFTGTWPNAHLHGGVGLEYKLAAKWSVVGEWTMDKSSHEDTTRTNNSFTLGVHYFF